jgi:bifunctional non-homologous end joining protein LigD
MTLDLDPGKSDNFDGVVAVAQAAHHVLDRLRVKNYCKTSGKTGIHVLVPLGSQYTFALFPRHRCEQPLALDLQDVGH